MLFFHVAFVCEESISASVYDLPNGERSWIPFVSPEFKPYVGAKFRTLDEVVVMYEEYAQMAGFCTRLGTTKKREGIIKTRYILCSKANKPKDQEEGCVDISSASSSRSVNFKVTDCKALIKVRLIKGSSDYEIYGFEEVHNHGPLSSNHLTKKRRKLDFATKEFISGCRFVCVGPTKAFKLHVALKGGHHNLKGTLTDYNNFGRDIREAIADGDAQMVVDKFNERSKNVHNFTFKYRVVGTELTSLFWADNVSKINYKAFGDVLAFDATYHTNM